jgi:hypothetical protein
MNIISLFGLLHILFSCYSMGKTVFFWVSLYLSKQSIKNKTR